MNVGLGVGDTEGAGVGIARVGEDVGKLEGGNAQQLGHGPRARLSCF